VDVTDYNGRTALHWACKKGFLGVAQLLIMYGANKEAKDFARKGSTPLQFAMELKHPDVVAFLLGIYVFIYICIYIYICITYIYLYIYLYIYYIYIWN
jgi:hypothetical protein